MALKNIQFDTIMREYNRKQLTNKREQDARIQEAYQAIPQLADIDAQIASLSISKVRAILEGGDTASAVQKDSITALGNKRAELLSSHGYPQDYLMMHYNCRDCRDTGYINNEKCHCFKQAIIDMLYTQSNIREVLETENFQHFTYEYYEDKTPDKATGLTPLMNMKKIVEECRQFIEHFDEKEENLFFYGNTGVGKTYLSHCIAKELIETAHSVIYFSAFELFDLFSKTTFQSHSAEARELAQMHSYVFDCDLLIIDDLGTELTNSFVSSQLFLCINERLMRKKSTIISTNLPLDIFRDTYSDRVFSRISSNYTMRKFMGDDIRIQKKIKGK